MSEYIGIFFILNIFTSINHIPTTKTVLPRYQNNLCVMSNKEFPERRIKLSEKILNMFRIRRSENENKIIFILFWNFMPGTDKLRIKRR